MKKTTLLSLIVMLLFLNFGAYGFITTPPTNVYEPDKVITKSRPNIIFLLGDGMGPEEVKAASIVEYGAAQKTIMDTDFTVKSLFSTNDIDNDITDSAAGGTALSTGQLTKNGVVGMNKDATIYFKNILEYLQYDFGYRSGLVTTTDIAHATPATFSSHVDDRNDYDTILSQMLDRDIDVLLGGGLQVSYIGSKSTIKTIASDNGYTSAASVTELKDRKSSADRLFGIFGHQTNEKHMPYEYERDDSKDPSIVEMTEAAIDVLSSKEHPFFLMVEGGRIDHAGHLTHYNNEAKLKKTQYNVLETIQFEKTVRHALEFAKADGNTIVIVGADHETGGLTVHDGSALNSTLPSASKTRIDNNELRVQRAAQLNVTWGTTGHTAQKVPFYMYGAEFDGTKIERNTDVFYALNEILGSFPVINSHQFVVENDTLTVETTLTDLDNSSTGIQVEISYANGTDKTYLFEPDAITGDHELVVPVDVAQEYTARFRVLDQDENDIVSFDSNNQLTTQSVTVPETTTTTTSQTTQTTSSTSQANFFSIVPLLSSILVLTVCIPKKYRII